MSPQPVAQSQARGGSADELQEVQITPQYILDEVEVTARRLDDNPTDSIRAGWSTSPDELRTIQADAAARPEGVVVSARKWNETDDRNLMHLTTPLWRGGGGMVDDYGDEIARRAIQMTDIGFDPVRQREDLALINELFTPWGQARTAFVGTYNFGVKLGGGFRSIPALFTGGVSMQRTRRQAGARPGNDERGAVEDWDSRERYGC